MENEEDSSDSNSPIIDDNVIRIQLRKPSHRKWELRTRNHSPGIRFPTVQLFDCEGNLLVETNDENISIKSSDYDEPHLRTSQSLREKDYKHIINHKLPRKHNTISGDRVYTRIYRSPTLFNENNNVSYIVKNNDSVCNIPSNLTVNNNYNNLHPSSIETTPFHSEGPSEASSYKSSDNETCEDDKEILVSKNIDGFIHINGETNNSNIAVQSNEENSPTFALQTSQSFSDTALRERTVKNEIIPRSNSGTNFYNLPQNKISFLNTYLRSLAVRRASSANSITITRSTNPLVTSEPGLCNQQLNNIEIKEKDEKTSVVNSRDDISESEFINMSTDIAADCELRKRLKFYRRGLSEIEQRERKLSSSSNNRRYSVSGAIQLSRSSSSESVDEADVVLNRLKRRIFKNKTREKHRRQDVCKLFNS
ncbi:hypothetical protein RR48_14728 [Papilio machaon]|uniref:Uncharacterized protein n=1 Tax=Papilio machaon TaxID=76193 RepID=A0A194R0P6_PAPMA|nr:hypothetical protein RR48_14728 [Papilio machaon]